MTKPHSGLKTKLWRTRDGNFTLEILSQFKSGPPPVNHPYSNYCWFPSYVSPWKFSFMPVVPSQSFPVLHHRANRKCVPLVTRKSTEFDCLKGLGWLWEVVSLMTLLNQPISWGLQAECLNRCWEPGRSSSIYKNWPQRLILESSMGREYSISKNKRFLSVCLCHM